MAKLQRIERSNGSVSYNINIPLEVIETTGFEKGEEFAIVPQQLNDSWRLLVIKQKDLGA